MSRLINCGTCGYPLTPEERAGLVEVDGVLVKLAQHKPLTDEEIDKLQHLIDWTALWSYRTFARGVEATLLKKNKL